MDSSWECLRKRLLTLRDTHGAVAAFCRAGGFPRNTVEQWLNDQAVPGLDKIDRIAAALGTTPSALLDPGTPAAPAIPQDRADVVQAILRADPHLIDAIRTLLLGYGKGVETDPPPSSRASLPEHRDHLPEKRKKRHE